MTHPAFQSSRGAAGAFLPGPRGPDLVAFSARANAGRTEGGRGASRFLRGRGVGAPGCFSLSPAVPTCGVKSTRPPDAVGAARAARVQTRFPVAMRV